MTGEIILGIGIGAEIIHVGQIGLRKYLEHRKQIIADGKGDKLLTSRVKKFARDNSPFVRFDSVYEDEKSEEDEIPKEKRPSSVGRFRQMAKRKSINGVNHAVEFLRKNYNRLSKSRESTPARIRIVEETVEDLVAKIEPIIENVIEPILKQRRFFFMKLKN